MLLRLAVLLGLVLAVSGCDPELQNRYRTTGPGLDLKDPALEARTKAQARYFDLLCVQADIPGSGTDRACDTGSLIAPTWQRVVTAGYNDIDQRCDEYLSWIDEQRTRMLFVNQGVNALQGLLGGVLGLAAPQSLAINYVTLALGFTTSVYNSYKNLALLGIEPSTIKTIVIERRLKFRREFKDALITSKPEAVYALRSYLMLCTPQVITLDVNTYSREAAQGRLVLPDRRIYEMRAVVGPVDVRAPATALPERPRVETAPGFVPGTGGQVDELRRIQRALCLNADGVYGPETEMGVRIFRRVRGLETTGDITANEVAVLVDRDCDATLYRNYYEVDKFARSAAMRADFVDILNLRLPELDPAYAGRDPLPTDIPFSDPEFRARVEAARRALPIEQSPLLRDELTREMVDQLLMS